jgi:Cullin family/Cullin protein neddylation domain
MLNDNPRTASRTPQRSMVKGSGPSKMKLQIKPYTRPPQLPSNYYETTADTIFQNCISVLRERLVSPSFNCSMSNATSAATLSLQHAYTSMMDLIRHQFGARLYSDLVQNMVIAIAILLPTSSVESTPKLLPYVLHQYQIYTEYLLLLKHICLPLDRAWQWQWMTPENTAGSQEFVNLCTGRAVPILASSTSAAHPQSTVAHRTSSLQNLWQVGLSIFVRRLQFLQNETTIYQQWLQYFLNDWNPNFPSNNAFFSRPIATDNLSSIEEQRLYLQQIWYMWQDLDVIQSLPIQSDLERYWTSVSNSYKDEEVLSATSSYSIANFVSFVIEKMNHCTNHYRHFLSIVWLWNILDHRLLLPHMSTQLLINDQYLFPVLHEQLFAASSHNQLANSSTSDSEVGTTVQQLWFLAGRVPNGQNMIGQVIQRFALQQGLSRIRPSELTTTSSNTAIEDILELQRALTALIHQLPGAAHTNSGNSYFPFANACVARSSMGIPGTSSIISFKSVWEEVMNVEISPSVAEQLAKFLDVTLRSNKKMDTMVHTQSMPTPNSTSATSAAMTATSTSTEYIWLQRVINGIFVPLQAKDIFEAFYKRDLAKRLLWNRVVSMDAEKYVCSLLKAECGTAYTAKIEGMFQDIEWSRETMLLYKQSTTDVPLLESGVDMEAQVLTTGYWPVYPVYPNLNIPDILKVPQDHFDTHYRSKYQGRRITWQYALGHCVVRVNGFPKTYELIVSLCQALVLLEFTSNDTCLTLPQLLQTIGLEDRDEMERILQSLALGKDGTRILRKIEHLAEPGKKTKVLTTIDDRDSFMINPKFESKSRRIRITNIMMKETKEEREKTVETVSRDRLYLIDAVLVRIMKARKTILHQALIAQVLEQVKVPAQAADVKKRIESLIEREYIERDTNDRNRYNYLA